MEPANGSMIAEPKFTAANTRRKGKLKNKEGFVHPFWFDPTKPLNYLSSAG
jgi:hypothetical protein